MRDGLSRFGDFLPSAGGAHPRPGASVGAKSQDLDVAAVPAGGEFARARGLNLEPRQTVLSAARELAATSRRAGAL